MGASDFFRRVKSVVTKLVDPEREKRIDRWASLVHRELIKDRKGFDFAEVASRLEVDPAESAAVSVTLFERCVKRAWEDRELTDSEAKSLNWIAEKLLIDEDTVWRIEREHCKAVFESVFVESLRDGMVDESEWQRLEGIASRYRTTAPDMIRSLFANEGESFVRNTFLRVVESEGLSDASWKGLLLTAERFGLSRNEFLKSIQHSARQYVEHVLADFKSDGEISLAEEDSLNWLMKELITDPTFCAYVAGEVRETKFYADIERGKLPSIRPPEGYEFRAGEIVHFVGPVQFSTTRQLSAGPRTDVFSGTAIITDYRFVFTSSDKAFDVNHRRVIQAKDSRRGMQIGCPGTGAGSYDFGDENRPACAVWRTAIRRANQTVVDSSPDRTRHIPQDIRQRVWQLYGGRCAECGAGDYLEFDHIVPHSKGGSNSEKNVQLLCRRCNLKKSANI